MPAVHSRQGEEVRVHAVHFWLTGMSGLMSFDLATKKPPPDQALLR